jgi:hypothetical protein
VGTATEVNKRGIENKDAHSFITTDIDNRWFLPSNYQDHSHTEGRYRIEKEWERVYAI